MRDGYMLKKKGNKRIKSKRKGKMKKRDKEVSEKEREEKSRERNFSLRSMEIGVWVFVGAKGKDDPRIVSYAWGTKILEFC